MAAGIQVWGDHGGFQIDGETPMVTLTRRVTVSATPLQYANSNNAYGRFLVPANPGEIIAVRCGLPLLHTGFRSGNAEYVMQGASSGTLDAWVFAPYAYTGNNCGMLVRSSDGTIIYDTSHAPMRWVRNIEGLGTFGGLPSGRNLAMVFTSMHTKVQRSVLVNPVPDTGFSAVFGNFAQFQGDALVIGSDVTYAVYQEKLPSGTISYAQTWDNGLPNRYTILDVTGN
jgi:hypothetical protein